MMRSSWRIESTAQWRWSHFPSAHTHDEYLLFWLWICWSLPSGCCAMPSRARPGVGRISAADRWCFRWQFGCHDACLWDVCGLRHWVDIALSKSHPESLVEELQSVFRYDGWYRINAEVVFARGRSWTRQWSPVRVVDSLAGFEESPGVRIWISSRSYTGKSRAFACYVFV